MNWLCLACGLRFYVTDLDDTKFMCPVCQSSLIEEQK